MEQQQLNEVKRMQQLAGITKTSLEGLKGIFHEDDNTYTYDHLIDTDSPSEKQLKIVNAAIEEDKKKLKKKDIKFNQVNDGTVPYLELINT